MAKKSDKQKTKLDRSILDMTALQARNFLLKEESYCNVELPSYFTFKRVLSAVRKEITGKALPSMTSKPRDHEGVNYSMLSNKDGRHAWRPFQLIHPALYISLVEKITTLSNWTAIKQRFTQYQSSPNLACLSIPIEAGDKKDKAAQILNWWNGIEQASLELSLDYNHCFQADITDCYPSIYTHSIAWAIHTRPIAKAKKTDKSLIGNVIDSHIQDMRHGQTNGIPQGSVLMDFIAETVLGYADLELTEKLKAMGVNEYRVLRYRDDYRIFVQSPEIGEKILKCLTEVLIGLGLKLSSTKTTGSLPVISSALKPDKRAWLRSRQGDRNIQKHLLVIHNHGSDFPNAGSLTLALTNFHRRLHKQANVKNPMVLISIATDIAYTSPRVFPICAAIISELLGRLKNKKHRIESIKKVYRKLSQLPNTGHMEIWLQRISHTYEPKLAYTENLCQIVKAKPAIIWNNDWITSNVLKKAINEKEIINRTKLKSLKPIIKPAEIAVFEWIGLFDS